MAQDSSLPDFWCKRYLSDVMPWDAGGVPEEFMQYSQQITPQHTIFIPGCGTGYEVGWLAERGYAVEAIEFSPAALEMAQKVLGEFAQHIHAGDFFTHQPNKPFDWVYERAFLCALPRKMWTIYAEQMANIIAPNGVLAGYFFIGDHPKGPPFGISQAELTTLLSPHFILESDQASVAPLPVFAGKERWQVWRRCDNLSH